VQLDDELEQKTIIASLEALTEEINIKEQELSKIRQRILTSSDSSFRNRLRVVREELREQQQLFEKFAVNVDVSPFVEKTETKFDWQREFGRLLLPIMAEVEFATRQSRVNGELRSQINKTIKESELAADALANLDKFTNTKTSPELTRRLENLHMVWKRRYQGAQDRRAALELSLDKALAQQKSPLDASISYVRNFLRTRGVNLLLGIIAFCIVFFGVRLLAFLWKRLSKQKENQGIGNRIATLAVHTFSILGGVLAALLVFTFTADWFLFAIALIFLIGVGWASFNALPRYIETLRLMLNIGAVREGERIVLDGIPWRVEHIGLRAQLVNPLLDGGKQMLPLELLVGKCSRPPGISEAWFPCRLGDWVELDNGKFGRVIYQTPSAVQIKEIDDSLTMFQTPAFLALNPRNVSVTMRVTSTFRIDYKHLSICTTRIPEVMQECLERELPEIVDAESIVNICVLFKDAASSSLDYEVWVDLTGNAIPLFKIVEYQIQRILVDACIKHGWELPFTQVTVHQAEN
jgi:hypothetical protein